MQFFLITFIYHTLKDLKDTIVITGSGAGAAVAGALRLAGEAAPWLNKDDGLPRASLRRTTASRFGPGGGPGRVGGHRPGRGEDRRAG